MVEIPKLDIACDHRGVENGQGYYCPECPLRAWEVEIDGDRLVFAARGSWAVRRGAASYGKVTSVELLDDAALNRALRVGGEDGTADGPGSYDSTLREELSMVQRLHGGAGLTGDDVSDVYLVSAPEFYW